MSTKTLGIIVAIAVFALHCSGRDDAGKSSNQPPATPAAKDAGAGQPGATGVSGRHRAGEDNKDWVPAEYKRGSRKWRDVGVYVDGKPVAVMWFGELPAMLEPVWLDDWAMVEFKAGDKGPRERKIKVRRYRLAEYLEGIGVDLKKINEIHIYGGRGFTAVIDGKQLRTFRDTLYFSFGRETSGKALIYFPKDIVVNTSFDHIAAIAIYQKKKPPTLVKGDNGNELELDGKPIVGIPYFGDPVRGGVRVYVDDHLATTIKRRTLEGADKLADKMPDGTLRWRLFPFLESRGVDTSTIVAAEVVFKEKRETRLTREQLKTNFFTANPQASGRVQLGEQALPMQALALYTVALPPQKPDVPPPVDP